MMSLREAWFGVLCTLCLHALSGYTFAGEGKMPAQGAPEAPRRSPIIQHLEAISLFPGAGANTPSPGPERPVTDFLVTTTQDSVPGCFRWAIQQANSSPGLDRIIFLIPGSGTKYVRPKDALPDITDPVIIDGTTAIGYAGTPVIDLDGSLAGLANGLDVASGSCTIKGIAVTRFELSGIGITGGGCTIEGCYIGVDPDGVTDAGNGLDGITVVCANNSIGVPGGARNVISGNGRCGVLTRFPTSTGNRIANCYIGTTADGSAALENDEWGVLVWDTQQITVGGATAEFRNVISGNLLSGIGIWGAQTQQVAIQGNYIGTNAAGNDSIPNRYSGIQIATSNSQNPSDILIGGKMAGEGNVISGNTKAGVAFFLDTLGGTGITVAGNMIGTTPAGSLALANPIGIYVSRVPSATLPPPLTIGGNRNDSANVISGNNGYGIWLDGPGVANTRIRGNYIGTTPPFPLSLLPLGNKYGGIYVDESAMNTIGGASADDGNVISSNLYGGIAVTGGGATDNHILHNWIGTDPVKNDPLGNSLYGIYLEASRTTVGGSSAPNTIAFNERSGIFVASGNRNTLRRNVMYGNQWFGIDLESVGVSPPDTLDVDGGANESQNFPVLDSARVEPFTITVYGSLLGKPTTSYTVDFYRNDEQSPSKFGEGKRFLGSATITTDANGESRLKAPFIAAVGDSEYITAMATDPDGNSSEFCRALCLKDSDGDGLFDCWETPGDGIDINNDGLIDLYLSGRGATPDHKDIFVEVDHMASAIVVEAALDDVREAFAKVPNRLAKNPDGKDGIRLHIQYEPADSTVKPDVPWSVNPWAEFFAAKAKYFGTSTERNHPNGKYLLLAKRLAYRYCIFIDSFDPDGSSGIAEYNLRHANNDFIVSIGNWIRETNRNVQAGTFMHELGHTLGLGHGGGDDRHFKPNYFSVMNYAWQFPQAPTSTPSTDLSWRLDYSPAALPTLDENNLDESKGLSPTLEDFPQAVLFPFNDRADRKRVGLRRIGARVNWDGIGDSSGAALGPVDVNYLDAATEGRTPGEHNISHADWPNLKYNFRLGPNFHDPGGPELTSPRFTTEPTLKEITPEIYDSLNALPPYGYLPPEAIPYLTPEESSVVGGNRTTLTLSLSAPARPGGVTYTLASSDPTILTVQPTVTVYEGWTGIPFEAVTRGVLLDTTVIVSVTNAFHRVSAVIHVLPANLASCIALPDSGCIEGATEGFRKKFLAGATILFQGTLDGEAPPRDSVATASSSRPDLVAVASAPVLPARMRRLSFIGHSSAAVSSPEQVIVTLTYRGISRSDTITLVPAPRYRFMDVSAPDTVVNYYKVKITNANQVLMIDGGGGGFLWKNGVHERLDTLTHLFLSDVAINDSGWIAGRDTLGRPAIWSEGTTTVLQGLDSVFSACNPVAINNKGEVTGNCNNGGSPAAFRGVVWSGGRVVDMGPNGDYKMFPLDINDVGQVLADGYYYFVYPNFSYATFYWENGIYTPIPDPLFPGQWSRMYGRNINDLGQALVSSALSYDSKGDSYVYVWKAGAYAIYRALPPYNRTNPKCISNTGQIVGSVMFSVEETPPAYGAFVAIDSLVYDLECIADFPPGWDVRDAQSVNDAGIIVGTALVDGNKRVFMLTPGGTTDIGEPRTKSLQPDRFTLSQNYPNPFNPKTVIRFQLPVVSEVRLTVHDILGRVVSRLVDGVRQVGTYDVEFDASNLASGVYFYRLEAGKFTQTRKMILMK